MTIRELTTGLLQVQHSLGCGPFQSVLVFGGPDFPRPSGSIFCHSGRASGSVSALPYGGKKAEVERLWRDLLSDPSQWRDHRMDKANPKFPDFKHKMTQEGLWLDSRWKPPWVEAKVAAIPPGTLELSIHSWNQMLSRCVNSGQYEKTMQLFHQMQRDGINSDRFTFVPVLKACASLGDLGDGRRIHTQIIQNGFEADIYLGSNLVDMYARCGSIEDAKTVFDQMPTRDVVSWTAMIKAYVKCGEGWHAWELFGEMQREGVEPDPVTFGVVLSACASIAGLEEGRHAHEQIIQRGYESDVFVRNSLVDMYARCGSIVDAKKVFNQMTRRDVVAWTTMIRGCVKCGDAQQALELFGEMQREGVDLDSVAFLPVLNACASIASLEKGRQAHEQIIQRGYESDIFIGNSLVDMYVKCGSILDAEKVFKEMPTRDVVAWNAMILGYVKCRKWWQALELYGQMQQEEVDPEPVTFVAVLNACASISALDEGRRLHEQIILSDYKSDIFVGSSLVDMYAKCGSIVDAERVFKDMPTREVVSWNAMILGYVRCGEGWQALELSGQMEREGVDPNIVTFVAVLNACASVAALEEGRHAHEQIIHRGYEFDVSVGTSLVDMYTKCGSIVDAEKVFKEMPTKDSVAWNAMILGYVKFGKGWKALELYGQMEQEGVDPDPVTFVAVLNACAGVAALDEGRHAHEQIIGRGYESDVYVGSSLVDMYAKCGSLGDAERVFKEMPRRDVVAWNAMIVGYVKCGEGQQALELSRNMQLEGVDPNPVTFLAILNACAVEAALEEGRHAHEQIFQRGYESDVFVRNSLVDMYAKCGSMADAERVFIEMPTRDVVAWNAMILGYVRCGQGWQALELSGQMQREEVVPDSATFVAVLNACASVVALDEGRRAHEQIIGRGYEPNIHVRSSLVDMYAKCGSIVDAERVFKEMPTREVVVWNAMMVGYVKCGEGQQALELYGQMERDGVDPNSVTFLAVLNACASLAALEEGSYAHEQIIQRGYESDVFVQNSLVDMYTKCGSMADAERVFNEMPTRDVVAWNAMILGYVRCGEAWQALELFGEMQREGVDPDSVTFLPVLKACASIASLEEGRRNHEQIIQRGYGSDIFIGNTLVDMYVKCGSIPDAEKVFQEMPRRDVVAWNAMILGYVKCGEGRRALELYGQMEQEEVDPNSVTFVAVLNACASVAMLEEGSRAHKQITQRGYESDIFVGNSLVDMYAKCGSIDDAKRVFKEMPIRNLVTWNTMLAGYGWLGYVKEALEHFKQMCEFVEVDDVTFVSLLTACSHGGAVDVGLEIFESMSAVHNISPTVVHYTCVVDLLGRVGRLCEAEDIIRTMPVKADACVWMALLGSCRVHGNVEMGERSARKVLELDPENSAGYVLLSNIYAAAGKWDSSASVHLQRLHVGV